MLAFGAMGAARYVSAETGPAGDGVRRQFLDRLAQNLNISTDELTAAITTTELQTVDDLLASGKITQAQADKLKEAINSGKGLGRLLLKRHELREKAMTALRHQIGASAAEAVGISVEELRDELQSGKSIADVAAEHDVSLDTVKSQIMSDVAAKLDQAVAGGRITQTREDEILQRLTQNLDAMLNKKKPV